MAPGKTSPRLLHDLLTHDPRHQERAVRSLLTSAPPPYDPSQPPIAAVPRRNCRHTLFTKIEQSKLPSVSRGEDETSAFKVASYCDTCRWHIDVVVEFHIDTAPQHVTCKRASEDWPLHHFLYHGETQEECFPALGSTHRFLCSAPRCPVQLRISFKPPRFSDRDLQMLTDQAQLRQRWERAKQLAGERADAVMARPVDALDYLNTYLHDCLKPAREKARIPLLNRKFLKAFGQDCDSILIGLGFTKKMEEVEDGPMDQVWYLPKPDETRGHPETTLRHTIEDALYELDSLIQAFPENERKNCRYQPFHNSEARADLERILGCNDYAKFTGRQVSRTSNCEEDHPYYASLGAVGDFSDALVLFAYSRQVEVDYANQPYYFECLQDLALGRKSEMLQMQVSLLASQGVTSKRDLDNAYRCFGIDPGHANVIGDDHIIGSFRARLSDISVSQAENARKQLRVLGDARNSEKIRSEAADFMETLEQAMAWLDLDVNAADDFVITMFTLKIQDNPSCMEKARKALAIIAEQRQSQRLYQFIRSGTITDIDMDIGEAYALFSVDSRTPVLDLDVLKTTVEIANPGDSEKLKKAFTVIQQDQAQKLKIRSDTAARPAEARRHNHPLETWPVGLRNIGNTCYLNSVLQFLFTIKPLREMILHCDEHFENLSSTLLGKKKVGRAMVTLERVRTAQKFVLELREFFRQMIEAPTETVQPTIDLASLALCRTDNLDGATASSCTFLGQEPINRLAISDPVLKLNSATDTADLADPAMHKVVIEDDTNMTEAKSETSIKAMDLGNHICQTTYTAPNRPPPVPPRPEIQYRMKIERLEESAQQQDAAEVMGNIFDLVSCAIKSEGVMREGEQFDTIKKLFYSDVTTVHKTSKGEEKMSELRNHYLVSPGGHERSIYATLDNDFGLGEMEGGGKRYDYIELAAPFQIINVRRLQFEKGMPQYDRSHITLESTLYMDRYLVKTQSLDEMQLLKLREAQWAKQQRLREVEQEIQRLKVTGIDRMNLADAIEETGCFFDHLVEEELHKLPDEILTRKLIPLPSPTLLKALHAKSEGLQRDLDGLETLIQQLEIDVSRVFKNSKDHPYRLHAIFTHSGDVKGGHYWIYIFDFQSNLWRSYNDDRVTVADAMHIFKREDGVAKPYVSTGVVYIRADLVDEYTEAVCRQPLSDETNDRGPTPIDVSGGQNNDLPSQTFRKL